MRRYLPLNRTSDAALSFYRDKLGLTYLRDDGFALVFDMNGVMLRIGKIAQFTPRRTQFWDGNLQKSQPQWTFS